MNQSKLDVMFGKVPICSDYMFKYFGGGNYAIKPFGIVLGTFNNIGAAIVIALADKVGFHSTHTKSQFIFVFTFISSYINSSLFVTWIPNRGIGGGKGS
jgi:hypothetical protein